MISGANNTGVNFKGNVFLKKVHFNVNKEFLPATILKEVKEKKLLGELSDEFVSLERKRRKLNAKGGKETPYQQNEAPETRAARKQIWNTFEKFEEKLKKAKFIDKDGNWIAKNIPLKKVVINRTKKNPTDGINTNVKDIKAFEIDHKGGEVSNLEGIVVKVDRNAKVTGKIKARDASLTDYIGSNVEVERKIELKGKSDLFNVNGQELELHGKSKANNVNFENIEANDSAIVTDSKMNNYKGKGSSKAINNKVANKATLNYQAQISDSNINTGEFLGNSKGTNLRFREISATHDAKISKSIGISTKMHQAKAIFLANSKFKGIKNATIGASLGKKALNTIHKLSWNIKRLKALPKNETLHEIQVNKQKVVLRRAYKPLIDFLEKFSKKSPKENTAKKATITLTKKS